MDILGHYQQYSNFVFIGQAGSGKSEVSLNFAVHLRKQGQKAVHFFDMDMTKPLFRSRDLEQEMCARDIRMHFQEQFMDTPTLVGGVRSQLKNHSEYTVLDVGGDDIGARSIGGFFEELNREQTAIFYVLNGFRPWADTIEHMDDTVGKILGVSHINLNKLHWVNNSHRGIETTAAEFIQQTNQLQKMLLPTAKIDFSTASERLYAQLGKSHELQVCPLHLFLSYPWQ